MKTEVDSSVGFFREQHISFRKGLSDIDMKNFSNLLTDEERFLFVQRLQSSNSKINTQDHGKNINSSKDFKEQGNNAFQKGIYNVALYFYTKSLLHFPKTSENSSEYAIIRANRSAALYHMQKYQLALSDIKEALNDGYPRELLYKINDRKARCLLALKQHKTALQAFRDTIVALDDAKMKSESRQKWQRDIQIMLSMMNKLPPKDEKMPSANEGKCGVKMKGQNSIYKAASSAIDIKYDPSLGRHAVARRCIPIGEVVLTETPHCAVLLQEYAATNCFHCLRRVESAEPCPTCARVVFCNKECLAKAMKHHSIECPVLGTLWSSGISVTCLLALRAVSQLPAQYFSNTQFKEHSGLWSGGDYKSDNYETFFNLVRNEDRRQSEDLLHRAHVAVFLFNCLTAANYFSNQGEEVKRKVGGILTRHLQAVQFNAHEVSELQINGSGLSDCRSVFIGGAVYPTLALFNHSCNPALVRYFNGTEVIARTIRELKEGEDVAENYGPIFTATPKSERLATLKSQYWFDCKCSACEEDWPLLDSMNPTVLPFRCDGKVFCPAVINVPASTTDCIIRCSQCNQTTNIIKGLKVLQDTENLYRLGIAYLDEGDAENSQRRLLELYDLVNKVLAPPYRDIHLCQQALRTCYLAAGNRCNVILKK